MRARPLAVGQAFRSALRFEGRWSVPAVTIAIVLAMLLPLVLWGVILRATAIADIAEREADQRSTVARLAGESMQRDLFSAAQSVRVFAARPDVQSAARGRDKAELDRRLDELLQVRRGILGAVVDPRGVVIAAPLAPELVGQGMSQRDYFRTALSLDGPYVSELFRSSTAGNPGVVAVSSAIRDGSETLGVAVLTLLPADVLAVLVPLQHVKGRQIVIVDDQSRVIASTDPALSTLDTIELPSPGAAFSQRPLNFAGRERIVTMATVPFARWTVYVVDDPSAALAPQRDLERQLAIGALAAGVVAALAALGIGWLYATARRQQLAIAERGAALQKVNEELVRASRHKSEFLAGMSHELRTPLNAILGFSELLEEQLRAAMSDRQRRYLRNVRDAGQHLLGLINDVLDLSKVEAGRVELRPETTTLGDLVDPVVSSTSAAAEAAGLRFQTEIDRRAEVFADVGRVRQILYNLLSNAVKFTPRDGEVAFRAGRSGHDLRIEVRDTGIGIPADKQDNVFGTFERLHEGRSDAPGTGLGLALTKSLVELQGGTITFESIEGAGTTFRVSLPEVVSDASRAERILVVEDDRRDAELVVALAAEIGLTAEVARSVGDALASIERGRPSAVVLDLRLSGRRGETVLEALRTNGYTSDVPVLVVSVEDDDGTSRALGAQDHLTKPIDRARLTAWLRSVAERSMTEAGRAIAAR